MTVVVPVILFTWYLAAPVLPSWGEWCVSFPMAISEAGKMLPSKLEQSKKRPSLECCCQAAKERWVPTKEFSLLDWAKDVHLQSLWRRPWSFQCPLSTQALWLLCLVWTSCLSLVQELISPRLALMEGACPVIDSSEWQWHAWSCLRSCPLKRVKERGMIQVCTAITALWSAARLGRARGECCSFGQYSIS